MRTAQMTETYRVARTPGADRRPSAHRTAWLLTAGAAALSLLLGATLPARAADRDDLAQSLIVAPLVGALVHEARGDNDRKSLFIAPDPRPAHKKKKRGNPSIIPAVCALEFEGARRDVIVYPERCLRREGVTGRLPTYCAKEARIWGKRDRVYSERCLRKAGFPALGRAALLKIAVGPAVI